MRMTKQDKDRIERLQVGLIDCHYTIKRLEKENKTEEIKNWEQYATDMRALIESIKAKYKK